MAQPPKRRNKWDVGPAPQAPLIVPGSNPSVLLQAQAQAQAQALAAAAVSRLQGQPHSKPHVEVKTQELAREVAINDAKPHTRHYLTKRSNQDEIQRRTHTVIVTRGRYCAPGTATQGGERPLYLRITPGSQAGETDAEKQRACDTAAAEVEALVAGQNPLAAAAAANPNQASVYIGFEAPPQWGLAGRVRGQGDSFLGHVANASGCSVQLRGRGSVLAESQEPLHLLINGASPGAVAKAKELVEDLVATVRKDFEADFPSGYVPPPAAPAQQQQQQAQAVPGYPPSYGPPAGMPGGGPAATGWYPPPQGYWGAGYPPAAVAALGQYPGQVAAPLGTTAPPGAAAVGYGAPPGAPGAGAVQYSGPGAVQQPPAAGALAAGANPGLQQAGVAAAHAGSLQLQQQVQPQALGAPISYPPPAVPAPGQVGTMPVGPPYQQQQQQQLVTPGGPSGPYQGPSAVAGVHTGSVGGHWLGGPPQQQQQQQQGGPHGYQQPGPYQQQQQQLPQQYQAAVQQPAQAVQQPQVGPQQQQYQAPAASAPPQAAAAGGVAASPAMGIAPAAGTTPASPPAAHAPAVGTGHQPLPAMLQHQQPLPGSGVPYAQARVGYAPHPGAPPASYPMPYAAPYDAPAASTSSYYPAMGGYLPPQPYQPGPYPYQQPHQVQGQQQPLQQQQQVQVQAGALPHAAGAVNTQQQQQGPLQAQTPQAQQPQEQQPPKRKFREFKEEPPAKKVSASAPGLGPNSSSTSSSGRVNPYTERYAALGAAASHTKAPMGPPPPRLPAGRVVTNPDAGGTGGLVDYDGDD